MVRYRTPIPFINQRPWSWFLFYLYLYFILLSLPIIITNRYLNFIKSQLDNHNISNESLIKLICQLILRYISSSKNDHSCVPSVFFFGPDYGVHGREWKWLLDNFKLIRVLELVPNSCGKIHSEIANFIHLRYLRIDSYCVTFVPDSILNLWNLQTIDLGISRRNIPTSF